MTTGIQRVSAAVILQGPALVTVERLIRQSMSLHWRVDAIAPPPHMLALHRVVQEALADMDSRSGGHADVPKSPDSERSSSELISTKETSMILKLSERQVRRLVTELGGKRQGKILVFDRGVVLEHAAWRVATQEQAA